MNNAELLAGAGVAALLVLLVFAVGFLVAYLSYARFKALHSRAREELAQLQTQTAELSSRVARLTEDSAELRRAHDASLGRIRELESIDALLRSQLDQRDRSIKDLQDFLRQREESAHRDYEALWIQLRDAHSTLHQATTDGATARIRLQEATERGQTLERTAEELRQALEAAEAAAHTERRDWERRLFEAEAATSQENAENRAEWERLMTETRAEVSRQIAVVRDDLASLRHRLDQGLSGLPGGEAGGSLPGTAPPSETDKKEKGSFWRRLFGLRTGDSAE